MFDVIAGRLCFDGQPLTAELPAVLVMRLEDHMREWTQGEPLAEQVDRLQVWEGMVDEAGKFHPTSLSENPMELERPEGWTETWLISKAEIMEIIE